MNTTWLCPPDAGHEIIPCVIEREVARPDSIRRLRTAKLDRSVGIHLCHAREFIDAHFL